MIRQGSGNLSIVDIFYLEILSYKNTKAASSRNQREKDIESLERVYAKTVHNPHHS